MTTPPHPQPGPYPPPPGPYPPPPPGPPIPGQPHAVYPPPPGPAKKTSFWTSTGGVLTIVFGSLGLVVLVCGSLVVVGAISDRQGLKQVRAAVTSCESTGTVATLGYSVTNNGKKARRVTLDIEYRDASGARLDTDTAYVGSVPAGDTVRGEEPTILDASSDSVTCRIVKIR